MNRHLSVKKSAFLGMKLLISLTALLLAAGNVYALQCNNCHNMPPLDSVAGNRDQVTGAFKGNHSTHAAAAVNSCTPCHGAGVLAYTAAHSSYTSASRTAPRILIASKINNYSAAGVGNARYNKGVFFNQTSLPVISGSTCSNVNCHFETTTPAWGQATPWSSTKTANNNDANCAQCHASTGLSSGKHAKHISAGGGTQTACAKCHPDYNALAGIAAFTHTTSANAPITVNFSAAPNLGGTYAGGRTGNNILPSAGVAATGNCTATYCHSPGNKASAVFDAPNQPATWSGSLTCNGCHKGDKTITNDPMVSGSHTAHVNKYESLTGYTISTISCTKCHAATTGAGMTIIDTSNHVNAKVNIKFNSLTTAVNGTYGGQASPYAKDPGTAPGQCNNVYCHSTVQSGANGTSPPTYSSPTWGGGIVCGSCHEGDDGHASSTSAMSTGSHTTHLSRVYGLSSDVMKCAICHNIGGLTMSAGQNCNAAFCHGAASAKHANGKIDLNINPMFGATGAYNGSAIPRAGFSNCSNISCHYNTATPVWGAATPLNCFGCHTLAMLSGSHAKHISASAIPTMYNYTANRSTAAEYDFGCSNCHNIAVSGHMNGTVNVTLNKNEPGIGTLRTKNSATGFGIGGVNSGITGTTKTNVVCSAAYCHSNGNTGALVYAATPNWYGGTFANSDRCANCHGNSPNSTIAGSKSHYNNKFLGYTSTAGGHQIGIHAMKIYSSPSGLAKAGIVGSSSHGNAGTSTTISCNICHYATVTIARNDNNGVCKTCHISGNTVGAQFGNVLTITNKSKHVNGTADIAFRPISTLSKAQMRTGSFNQSLYSSVWKRNVGYKANGAHDSAKGALNTATMWNGTTKTCSNIACHNGQSVKWSDNGGTTSCVSCHTAL